MAPLAAGPPVSILTVASPLPAKVPRALAPLDMFTLEAPVPASSKEGAVNLPYWTSLTLPDKVTKPLAPVPVVAKGVPRVMSP